MGFEWLNHPIWAYSNIVVAEHGETLRSFECGKDFGTNAGGFPGYGVVARAAAHKVSSEQNQVWSKRVSFRDHLLQEPSLGIFLQMDVRDLDDTKSGQRIGQVADGDGLPDDLELMPPVGSCVQRDPSTCHSCSRQKGAACDVPAVFFDGECRVGSGTLEHRT